jgi:hypothetical protein
VLRCRRHVRFGSLADIAETELGKQKHRREAVFRKSDAIVLPFGLNNRGFTLANRSLAFAYAASKPKGENYRTNCNQQFSHGVPQCEKVRGSYRHHS